MADAEWIDFCGTILVLPGRTNLTKLESVQGFPQTVRPSLFAAFDDTMNLLLIRLRVSLFWKCTL